MYQVLELKKAAATRFIYLQNESTGTIDYCFDDSGLTKSDETFDFMKVGAFYDCKIELFGDIVKSETSESVRCKITNSEVTIGKYLFLEVLVQDDIYYLPHRQLTNEMDMDEFFFHYTRKDLIQVGRVVHGDLL